MIDLDHEAESHLQQLEVPLGIGLEAVMKTGSRRRRLRNIAVASGTLTIFGMLGLGFAAIGTDSTTVEVAVEGTSGEAGDDAQREFFEALPSRVVAESVSGFVPIVDGWTVQRSSLDLTGRFDEGGSAVSYVLTGDTSTVNLSMVPGNVGSTSGSTVELSRPDRIVEAWLDDFGGGTTALTWNERPGVNTGTAVTVKGDSFDDVVAVSQAVEFVDGPLEGAGVPVLVDLSDDRIVILEGEVGDANWHISDNGDDVVVEINEQSPWTGYLTAKQGLFDVELTSISSDGLQVHLLKLPAGASAATIIAGEFFPARSVNYNDTTYAVVIIPPGKDAVAIRVEYDSNELTVPLPLAPPTGWSTHRLEYGTD